MPITPELLQRLRRFWCAHRNPDWLFPGLTRRWKSSQMTRAEALGASKAPISNASVWAAIKVASAECGLSRKHDKICTHTLRHPYATHLLDAGVSPRQVAAYLGHSTSQTPLAEAKPRGLPAPHRAQRGEGALRTLHPGGTREPPGPALGRCH